MKTSTSTFARTELVRTQILWAEAILNPNTDGRARRLIRQSFQRDAFRALAFYALGSDGLCYAKLIVGLDAVAHEELLLVDPRVKISAAWRDRIAPDLRLMVEQFENIVSEFQLRISLGLAITPGVCPELEQCKARQVTWANTSAHGIPYRVRGLAEVTLDYLLSDALSPPQDPSTPEE